jgi:tetratricopeptide (TPR) repeat protein/energy-coupling factor transporter ATP-binding protein EcfA2
MNMPVTEPAIAGPNAKGGGDAALSPERPFPGLRPFTFEDREFFFGRERQAFALYRLVENGRFVAVVGSSGSGKSSLVLAGLCGLLADESNDPGGPKWVCLGMRPGASPISRLAKALAELGEKDSPDESARRRDRIEYLLRQSSFSFESALKEAGGLGDRSLLLIVDQFEELFRFGLAGLGAGRATIEETRARDEATQFVQILLDADRRRLKDVRVLITMRSDFIGDCAYFHGLSEAVSATQYLVPNMTRGQLEDAIRKPIDKAGASIEPELVERLINDCGDELDQLPVLQHCLMRLWIRAGAEKAEGPRQLTRQTYDDIGRMTEALSRHADEVLRQCTGKELAVEQAFRALSELDREGRAIRRGRRFDKLLAETGVSESDLRDVLDKFRAPSCSFLVPPLSATLRDDDVVDIGHEALLRRWKMLSGDAQGKTPSATAACPGWLAEERGDGDRYHTLVSLLDGEKASLTAPEETKRWWDGRPRTAAWAERYGGKFESVKKLIDDNIESKRRSLERERRARRDKRIAAVLVGVGLFLAVAAFWAMQEREQRREIAQQKLRQEEIDKSAMTSAKTLLENVLGAYNDKSLDLSGAESLAKISGQFLVDTRAASRTSAADLLWGEAMNVEADLQAKLDKDKEALDLARSAKKAALSLIQSNPDAQEPLQVLHGASIRAGDALSALGKAHRTEALQEYRDAIGIAGKIASLGSGEAGDDDVIDAHIKIGDIYKDNDLKPDAEAEYRSGLAACDAALAKHPQNFELLRNEGKAFFRIADLLRTEDAFEPARTFYRQAADVQQALILRNAQESLAAPEKLDPSLKSNLAATYTHWGMLEKKAGDLNLALTKLKQGAALDEELVKAQPGNPQWEDFVAPSYAFIADILSQLNRPKEALDYYQKLFEARRALAFRGLGPAKARREFADAARLLGDHASGLTQIDAYRSAVRTWSRLVEEPKLANAAAEQYDAILTMARVFDAKKDWPDAQSAYLVASKMATLNFTKDTSNTSWRDKAESAEKASVEAGLAAETAPPSP